MRPGVISLLVSVRSDLAAQIDLPHRSMANIQLSAEYVAYGIPYLAKQSAASGNKISIISHSQGGVDVGSFLSLLRACRQVVDVHAGRSNGLWVSVSP